MEGGLARLVRRITSSHTRRLPRTPSALGVIARALAAPGLRGIAKLRLLPNGSGVSDGAVLVAICHGVIRRQRGTAVSASRHAIRQMSHDWRTL